MLKHIISRQIDAFEKQWNYSMDYTRELLALGSGVLKRFHDATKIGEYVAGVPKEGAAAAKILGVMQGDCGPCVQLGVDMARAEGVDAAALEALLRGDFDALPSSMRLSARFTRALLDRSEELPELREQVREAYGVEGLVTLAYAVIASGIYPTVKYALGHGQACSAITIEGRTIAPTSSLSSQVA